MYGVFGFGTPDLWLDYVMTPLLLLLFFTAFFAPFYAPCCFRRRSGKASRGCCGRCCRVSPCAYLNIAQDAVAAHPHAVAAALPVAVVLCGYVPASAVRMASGVVGVFAAMGYVLVHGGAGVAKGAQPVGQAVVLLAVWRWCTRGAALFVVPKVSAAAPAVLGAVTLGLQALTRYTCSMPTLPGAAATSHTDDGAPAAPTAGTASDDGVKSDASASAAAGQAESGVPPAKATSEGAPALGAMLGALLTVTLWLAQSPSMVLHLSRTPDQFRADVTTSWDTSRALAPLAPLCAMVAAHAVAAVGARRAWFSVVVPPVTCVFLVVGIAVVLYASSEAAALFGGSIAVAAIVLAWHVWASFAAASLVTSAANLTALKWFSAVYLASVLVTVVDWLGFVLGPSTQTALWLLVAALAASGTAVYAHHRRRGPTVHGAAALPPPSRWRLAVFGVLVVLGLIAGIVTRHSGVADTRRTTTSRAAASFAASGEVNVVAWNVQRGWSDVSRQVLWGDVVDALEGADLVGLQESASVHPLQGSRDTVAAVSEGTGLLAYSGKQAGPRHTTFTGTAVLSGFPLSDCKAHNLPGTLLWSRMVLTVCAVNLPGTDRNVTMASVHPILFPTSLQTEQFEDMTAVLRGAPAIILAGDFNSEDGSSSMRRLYDDLGLANVLDPNRLGNVSFPSTRRSSDSPVDHILFSPADFEVVSAAVDFSEEGVSDHTPVRATLRLL